MPVALVVGEGHWALAESALRAANAASVGPLAVIDLSGMLSVSALEGVRTVVAALDALDRALAKHRTVVMVTDTGQQDLSLLLRHMDRAVALANATQVRSIASLGDDAMRLELFLRGWPDSACDARSIAREARSLDIQNTIVSRPAMAGTPSVPD